MCCTIAAKGGLNMAELLIRLHAIGMTDEQCIAIIENYNGDLGELLDYVLYCVAILDDRHEYMA